MSKKNDIPPHILAKMQKQLQRQQQPITPPPPLICPSCGEYLAVTFNFEPNLRDIKIVKKKDMQSKIRARTIA